MLRSLSFWVLTALLLGLAAGAAIQASGDPRFASAVDVIGALGSLWLNALRMTVVPLLFALLVTGVASVADAASAGRLTGRALLLFSVLLVFAAGYSLCLTSALLTAWPVDRASAAAIIAGAQSAAHPDITPPSFAAWIQALAPSNAVHAAAEDQILPLVVFALFFGFAATKLAPALRDPITTFFRAVSEAMIVIVHWVLRAGPFGVFALALAVGAHAGLSAAGAIAHYIAIAVLVTFGVTLIAWLLAVIAGRAGAARFTAAATPVWAIAFSTQSSLASLPAMLTAARERLGISERVADVVLPLAVAVFRFTSPVTNLVVVLFCAAVFGIHLGPGQYAAGIFVSFAASIAAVGLPGQVSFFTSIVPISLAMGVPIDLLGVLLAVEVVPDIFRTLGNVTGDLAATTILGRRDKAESA